MNQWRHFNPDLPLPSGEQLVPIRLFFVAVAQGVVQHLRANPEAFEIEPGTSGLLLYPVSELNRMIDEADAAGFQLAVHAIGDRANALVLDAFEKAAAARPRADRRFRIEHAQVVRRADLARYAKLRVVASIQPSHCIDDMRWAPKRIGVSLMFTVP